MIRVLAFLESAPGVAAFSGELGARFGAVLTADAHWVCAPLRERSAGANLRRAAEKVQHMSIERVLLLLLQHLAGLLGSSEVLVRLRLGSLWRAKKRLLRRWRSSSRLSAQAGDDAIVD